MNSVPQSVSLSTLTDYDLVELSSLVPNKYYYAIMQIDGLVRYFIIKFLRPQNEKVHVVFVKRYDRPNKNFVPTNDSNEKILTYDTDISFLLPPTTGGKRRKTRKQKRKSKKTKRHSK